MMHLHNENLGPHQSNQVLLL